MTVGFLIVDVFGDFCGDLYPDGGHDENLRRISLSGVGRAPRSKSLSGCQRRRLIEEGMTVPLYPIPFLSDARSDNQRPS